MLCARLAKTNKSNRIRPFSDPLVCSIGTADKPIYSKVSGTEFDFRCWTSMARLVGPLNTTKHSPEIRELLTDLEHFGKHKGAVFLNARNHFVAALTCTRDCACQLSGVSDRSQQHLFEIDQACPSRFRFPVYLGSSVRRCLV